MADDGDNNGGSPPPKISEIIPFGNVAELLEKISKAESNDRRKTILKRFMDYYRAKFKEIYGTLESEKAGGDSLYPLLRVLIPDVDRGRRAYGFKSSTLGRMFASILGLDKKSKDARRLIGFKDPVNAGALAGDIGTIIYDILNSRFSTNATDANDKLSLYQIHEVLDKLAKAPESDVNQEQQKKILQTVIRKMSALEGKWLIRLLLKELRLGFSSTKATIYGLLHPQAKVLSERIGDLEILCQKLNDPSAEVSEIDISLFHHFAPMLATRMDIIDSNFEIGGSLKASDDIGPGPSKKSKQDSVSLPPPPFYVETKWDGERFQIHYDGQNFKYFSRRAFDYTAKFGETLTSKLKPQINSHVASFILDGEMMAYNKNYQIFTTKGYNIDVKTINKDNPNHCPVFVAFDLVYYNGKSLTKIPLRQRREKLEKVFMPRVDAIRLGDTRTMNSKEEVIEALNSAIDDGEEGLIAKDMNSVYEPGQRGEAWLKIKPEYLEDNMVDDLDLLILGGYYTESVRKGGEITHFLIGLIDKSKGNEEYFPVAKVGTGRLRSIQVKDLVKDLTPKFVKTPFNNVNYRARKKPDFMINPLESIVVQVKASEIIPSDVYAAKYTLRFPRITKVRKDKCPKDTMTIQEFIKLNQSCGGKLAKRTDGASGKGYFFKKKRKNADSDDERDTKYQRPERLTGTTEASVDDDNLPGPSKLLKFQSKTLLTKSPLKPNSPSKSCTAISPIKISSVSVNKNVFNSKVFCVYGASVWKSRVESDIRKHGGNISQSPDVKDLFAVVGERKNFVLVDKAIRNRKYDVLQPSWINSCIDAGREIAPVPSNFWGITEATREKFADEYDEYGDSYTNENTLQQTKDLLQRVMEEDADKKKSPTKASNKKPNQDGDSSETDDGNFSDGNSEATFSRLKLLKELFPNNEDKETSTWNFLQDIKIAIRGQLDEVILSKCEFYGLKVASDEQEEGITHVVVSCKESPSKANHARALVVSQKWLEDCLEQKKEVDERRYSAL